MIYPVKTSDIRQGEARDLNNKKINILFSKNNLQSIKNKLITLLTKKIYYEHKN